MSIYLRHKINISAIPLTAPLRSILLFRFIIFQMKIFMTHENAAPARQPPAVSVHLNSSISTAN